MVESPTFTSRQLVFRELFVGTLIYVTVLGFYDDYTTIVEARSFRFVFLAAIVLELLTMLTFATKGVVVRRLGRRGTRRSKLVMAFGVWFVMFSSKFVFIWAIDFVFGDDVDVDGFVGVLAVAIPVTVVHRLADWTFVRLGEPPAEPRP